MGSVWITDRCRHSFFPEKVEIFIFQFFFSVINMKIQLTYFCYCSIVIMVSRWEDGHWGQCGLLIDVDIVFFRKKLKFLFFNFFFCNQYEISIEVFLLLFYCYNGIPFRGWSLESVWITDRCRHSFFPEKVEFFFSNFFCNQYESSIEVFLLLFYCYNGI